MYNVSRDGTFYFGHSKYNRQGTRILQVLRCIFPGFDGGSDRNAMVFTLNADGGDVQFTGHDPVWGYPLGGHPNWHPNGIHVIRNMKPDGKTARVCQFKYDGSDFKLLSDSFDGIGHLCWSRDYKKVSLQGTHQGARQLYVVDMGEWIS